MSDSEDYREKAGKVVYRGRLHWVVLLGPAVLMLFAGLSIPAKGMSAVIILILGTAWAVCASVSLHTTEFALTETSILIKIGFPRRRHYDIPLAGVDGVDIVQPTLGRILNFGKMTITSGGKKRRSFRMVNAPLQLSEKIYEQIEAARSRGTVQG